MTEKKLRLTQKFFQAVFNLNLHTQPALEEEAEKALPATSNLLKLIDFALQDQMFLKTESVLRLNANEVKKNKALANLSLFFKEYQVEPDFAVLGALLKNHLRASITNEQKNQLVELTGLEKNNINIGYLPSKKMKELEKKLKEKPPEFTLETPQLSHFIYLCQQIAKNSIVNKMTASNITTCITPLLLPSFDEKITRAFIKNINLLMNIIVKNWIKTANTKVEEAYSYIFDIEKSKENNMENSQQTHDQAS